MDLILTIPNFILYVTIISLIIYFLYDSFFNKNTYTITSIAAIALMLFCVYGIGYKASRIELDKEIAHLNANIEYIKAQQKIIDKQVVTQYVDRVKTVKDVQYVIQTKIKEKTVKIDSNCTLDPEVPLILNAAATNHIEGN